jgi:hypothetical protein
VLRELTTNQKGLIPENAVVREAILFGIGVSRPLDDERYDLVLDFRPRLVRKTSGAGSTGPRTMRSPLDWTIPGP